MSLLQRQPYQESTFQLLQPLSSRPRKTTCVTADHVPPNNFPIYRAIFWFYCAINVIYRAIKKIWLSSLGHRIPETSRALCERPAWSHANERLDDALLLKRAFSPQVLNVQSFVSDIDIWNSIGKHPVTWRRWQSRMMSDPTKIVVWGRHLLI